MRLLAAAAALLALAPCALAGDEPALHGIETADLDRSVGPCTDFFEFANGGWRAKNPIPASMLRWSRRWQAGESTKEQLRAILDEVSARESWPRGSVEQLVGDHYAACMDEPRANQLGVEPVRPLLDEVANLPDIAGVIRTIGRFHELGIPVPFGVAATPDRHDPAQVIADVYASGLGLPDRDYYVKGEPRFKEAREKYQSHVMRMLELGGEIRKDARRDAEAVLGLETKLAQAQLDNVALRDPKQTDHRTGFVALTEACSMFDWPGYFAAAKLPRAALNVQQPAFLRAVDRLFQDEPLPAWKAYLRWQLMHSAAAYLAAPVVEEDFGFFGKYLGGAAEMKPRWKRCTESTDALLGEALGRKYVERYFPPAAKARVQEMVKNLLLAMGDTIRG
ncbi:MAG TPA: M13 family metallopeptidase N-terminal domain-containing protein, partial [Vicinamibacteria bacterium]|nr:M13 family metallopeptidase N-terminal domain-containing protein [Vicinamibacteria bacterium]